MNRSALGILVAAAMLSAGSAWADGCAIGRRVSLDDGNRGAVVASVDATHCYVELDNGTVASASVETLIYDDATGGRPPITTPPAAGTYVCTTPGFGAETALTFSIVDAQNYSSSTGQRQPYRWDASTSTLELMRANGEPQRFLRTAEKAFRRFDGDTLTDTGCVLNGARRTARSN
jgi:hypothetical protein